MVLRRVLLVDGNVRLTQVLASLLADEDGFSVVGTVHARGHALALAREARPDVVLVSETVGGVPGARVCAELRALLPDVTLLLWASAVGVPPDGVDGLLERGMPFRALVRAVRAVHAGQAPPAERSLPVPPVPAPPARSPGPDDGRLHLECRTCELGLALPTQDMPAAVAGARAFFAEHAECETTIDLTDPAVAARGRRRGQAPALWSEPPVRVDDGSAAPSS